jgi:hypothetical protein
MSKFDATSTLVGLVGMRASQVLDTVVFVGKVAIIHVLVRRLLS